MQNYMLQKIILLIQFQEWCIHIQSDNTLTVNDISSHTGKVKGQGDIVITGSHTIGAFIDTSDSTQDNINTRISGSGTTVTLGSSNVLPDDEDLTVETVQH